MAVVPRCLLLSMEWRYGETIRDMGRWEHVSAGRPTSDNGLRARSFIWPPLRLARMRRERGSVVAVLPVGSLT
jgi:hypothetical protein